MSNYRRAFVPGGYYFFTVVTHHRSPILASPAAVARLREAFRRAMARRPFEVEAVVVLPDHLHALWRLPEGDVDFSARWRDIKHYVSAGIEAPVNRRREKRVWQRRFWEHLIRDEEDWRRHLDYIHFNPVKHGLVARAWDWEHGSFRRWVERGFYDRDWGMAEPPSIAEMEPE